MYHNVLLSSITMHVNRLTNNRYWKWWNCS